MSKENNQGFLFDVPEGWEEEWQGMPEFVQERQKAYSKIIVRLETGIDLREFSELIGQKLTSRTKSIWYPEFRRGRYANKRYVDES